MDRPQPRLGARTIDVLLVVGVASVALAGLAVSSAAGVEPGQPRVLAALILALTQAGVLWWRRSRPLLVLALALGALVAAQAFGDINAASFLGPHVAAYSLAVHGRGALWRGAIVLGAAALADGAVIGWVDDGPSGAVLLGPGGLLVLAAWGVGRYVRIRREYLDTLHAYARHLEVERDQRAEEAVREERRRIARELHDQVAHELGVVSLQASAARRWMRRDVERSEAALQSAEAAARRALTTMPAILRALRTEEARADLEPQPGLDQLDDLVERVSATGLPVELRFHGRRAVHPAVELTAYRLVQEALTNVMKHAEAGSVTVDLRFNTDELLIDVVDDGHGAAAAVVEGGHGLVGMRERVQLVGGQVRAGPRPGGGFAVSAALPSHVPAGAP